MGTLYLHPEGTASWFYDLWCFAGEDDNDWKRWSTPPSRGNVPPEEVEAARAQLDPRTFRQEFEASFENLSGLVAINFSDENISKSVTDIPQLPLWIGLDFNVDNMSAVFGIRVDEELHIFDELIMVNATTWDVRRRNKPPLHPGAQKTFPRPHRRRPKDRRRRPHRPRHPPKIRPQSINTPLPLENPRQSQLRQHRHPRFRWSAPPKNPPRCRETIKSLRTLVYDDNGLPNKKLGVDHCFDALGYLCLQKFNLNKHGKLGQTTYRVY